MTNQRNRMRTLEQSTTGLPEDPDKLAQLFRDPAQHALIPHRLPDDDDMAEGLKALYLSLLEPDELPELPTAVPDTLPPTHRQTLSQVAVRAVQTAAGAIASATDKPFVIALTDVIKALRNTIADDFIEQSMIFAWTPGHMAVSTDEELLESDGKHCVIMTSHEKTEAQHPNRFYTREDLGAASNEYRYTPDEIHHVRQFAREAALKRAAALMLTTATQLSISSFRE